MPEHKIVELRFTAPQINFLAMTCLILSVLGVIVTFFVPFLTQAAAIICGHVARAQIRNSEGSETGSGIALAGLMISYLAVALYIIFVLILGLSIIALF